MQRWILNLIGLALLAVAVLLAQSGPGSRLAAGESGTTAGMSEWLSLSITAGGYLLTWGPVLLAALIFYYANRRHR